MDKLTLDTNILRDWAWCEERSDESRYTRRDPEAKRRELRLLFNRLKALRDAGVCELGITTRLYRDFGKSLDELPPHIAEMIGPYVQVAAPHIFGYPLSFPVVFPNMDEVERMFRGVFPDSVPGQRQYESNRKDVWQLYAHRVAGRDVFITQDQGILSMRSILAKEWGVRVSALDEYVCEASAKAQV